MLFAREGLQCHVQDDWFYQDTWKINLSPFRPFLRMLMHKSTLQVDGREVNLVPGMSISAEVKIGKRYLIEYILTPLLRYKNESVRER